MKRILRDYGLLAVMAAVIITLDQLTKSWVRANLALGEAWVPFDWLGPFVRIVHWYNTGSAFGMFQGLNPLFIVLAFIVIGVIIYYFPRVSAQDWTLRVALGMQLSGASGNLIDRLTVGHVTDFVSVGSFPVFNVADASISVGVAFLLLGVWLQDRREKETAGEPDQSAGEDANPEEEAVGCE